MKTYHVEILGMKLQVDAVVHSVYIDGQRTGVEVEVLGINFNNEPFDDFFSEIDSAFEKVHKQLKDKDKSYCWTNLYEQINEQIIEKL